LLNTSQFKTVCKDDSVTHHITKTAKIKEGDITCQHIDYVAMCCQVCGVSSFLTAHQHIIGYSVPQMVDS